MSERYDRSVIDLIKGLENGQNISRYGRIVEISGDNGSKFLGACVGKSIVIPLSAGKDTDDSLKNIVGANLLELDEKSGKNLQEQTCNRLRLPYNGPTLGLYSDGHIFGQISAVHIYPAIFVSSTEEFMNLVKKVFASKNLKITFTESL